MGASHIGLQARLMSQALRKITAIAARTNTAVIFINQIRMQIGVMFGNPETTSGGMALKFYSSVRIEVRKAAKLKKGEEIVGHRVKVKIAKNKIAAPFKTTEYDILFNEGISVLADVFNLGAKYGIIKKEGITYSFGDIKLGAGMEKAKTALKENQKMLNDIIDMIKEKMSAPDEETDTHEDNSDLSEE
jgi:recombination protein RecA